MYDLYNRFLDREYPSQPPGVVSSEVRTDGTSSKPNQPVQAAKSEKIGSSSSFAVNQVEAEKRKSSEIIVNGSEKKQKIDLHNNEPGPSTSDEKPLTCHDRSNDGKIEKDTKHSSIEKLKVIGSFVFGCFHCNNANIWNENLNDIFDHCKASHSNDNISLFLFHIIYQKKSLSTESSKLNVTLTNFQLKRLLSIENPLKQCQSDRDLEKRGKSKNHVEYLLCGECDIKLNENDYLKHIERHANKLKAKKNENDLKMHLKLISSKTKVVFSNGLVLTKMNLSTTDLGDDKKIDRFIDTLLKIKMEKTENACSSSSAIKIDSKRESKSLVSSTSTSNSSLELLSELEKQRQRINSMSIIGMSQSQTRNETLQEIFLRICQKLQIDIDFEADILEIFRASPKVVGVKFTDVKKKEEILNCTRIKSLYTIHIFNDVTRDKSKKIIFKNYLTLFYGKIDVHLKSALQQGRIYSYKLTKYGFEFKKTENSNAEVVLSIRQFEELMLDEN